MAIDLARRVRDLFSRGGKAAAASAVAPPEGAWCEQLEPRVVLFGSPFLANLPTLDDLANHDNTVVRFQLSAGTIDIELFDVAGPNGSTSTAAPRTAANFLRYVNTGRYDNTFIHRFATLPGGDPFVLQGGGFSLKDPLPASAPRFNSVQSFGTIVNEFSPARSNIERTLSMAKLGGNPDSATSQFFINLNDNSDNLDNQNGGFTVFARIVKGWDVITRIITDFTKRDLNIYLNGSSPSNFAEVPLSNPTGNGSNPAEYLTILDAEVIKLKNARGFLGQSIIFPDGFRSPRVTTDVQLVNTDPNEPADFQIIARYATGQRDQVVLTGRLEPGAQRTVRLSDGVNPGLVRVRPLIPYAPEIRSSRPVIAQWTHRDFGATASESFISTGSFNNDQLRSWSFANAAKGPGISSFVAITNLDDEPVTITATFIAEAGDTRTSTITLGPYRRGGLSLGEIPGIPDGALAVRLSADKPIVASLSQYRQFPPRASADSGTVSSGGSVGVLAGALIPEGGQATIALVYSGDPPEAVVDIDFILSDGSTLTASPITLTSAIPRREIDVESAVTGLPIGQFFTIRYRSRDASIPVAGTYTTTSPAENARSAFQTFTTSSIFFAGGFTDTLTQGEETLSLFNSYLPSAGLTITNLRVKFHFINGPDAEVIIVNSIPTTIANGQRLDLRIRDLPEIMARINSGLQFRRYGISVEVDVSDGSQSVAGGIAAQLTRTSATTLLTSSPALNPSLPAQPMPGSQDG